MPPRKYKNVKIEVDGVTFDSKAEARHYESVLKPLLRTGAISDLRLQPEYELQPSFRDSAGKKHRPIIYRGDFEYREGNRVVCEDVKGFPTPAFKLKEKMFRYIWDAQVELRIVK